MQLTRRHALLGATAFALAPQAHAQELKKIRFGIGLRAMGPAVINTVIGETLGYNKEEGFTLVPAPLGTNANVQIAVDKGDVDIGIGVPSFGLPLLSKGEWQGAVNFYQYTYPYKWDVATLPNSAIKTYQDLKGKRIGVSDFGASEFPVTKRVLKGMGFDPENDFKWIPVGNGIQAGVALQRDVIDALAYFDTGFGQIEGGGVTMTYLPRPVNLPMIGGQFLMAKKEFLASDKKFVVGFARSVAKTSVFLQASPEAGAKAFLRQYPETAPRGASEEDSVKAIVTAIRKRIDLYKNPYAGQKMGAINEKEFTVEAEMAGLPALNGLANYYTNSMIDEINNFDAAKIVAAAKAYK